MLFNSYVFVFAFLPLVLVLTWSLAHWAGRRPALGCLVLASLVYYGWWDPRYILLIGVSIFFNFFLGRLLDPGRNSGRGAARRSWLALGIACNLGLLGYYKYTDFFMHELARLSGANWQIPQIILPIGISFFTFQQIAYLVDAYQGRAEEPDFLNYCLFVSFFPQLIAGPIVHHQEMLPQFAQREACRYDRLNLVIGLTIFIIGLAKKVIIADQVALYSTPVFDLASSGRSVGLLEAWQAALAYTLQIYFDFSGYSDMAIGLARMVGVKLPLNFNSPYKSANIVEFWRRWHMTLSRFLRDYLYIPLGGNRRGKPRRYLNVMITMLLGGLWHGANWTFVFWGGLHGLFILAYHGWRRLMGPPRESWAARLAARALTFLSVVAAWVFFRADSFASALNMLKGMAGLNGISLPVTYRAALGGLGERLMTMGVRFVDYMEFFKGREAVVWIGAGLLLAWLAPNTQQIMARFRPALGAEPGVRPILSWRPDWRWALAFGVLAAWATIDINRASEFIYFQF